VPRKTDAGADAAAFDFPCACATARRAARAMTQLYDRHLRESGIEGTQFALLSALHALGPSNQSAIARRFALDKTTLSRNLKLLRRKGWIAAAAAGDARERRYVLSAAGEKRLAAAKPAWRRAQNELRASMTVSEWNAMWKAFHVVTEAASGARRDIDQPWNTP
jgi:DNA-binding MarR family transcriptional regulator